MSFTGKILISMGAGILVGLALNYWGDAVPWLTDFLVSRAPAAAAGQEVPDSGLFKVIGDIFVTLLRMMVVPLVFVSLVCGVHSLGDVRSLGRVGVKTIGLYLATTAVAIVIALVIASWIDPGQGIEAEGLVQSVDLAGPPPLSEVLVNMFPANPIRAMADGQMLQIIVFSLLFGFALSLAGEAGKRIGQMFFDFNDIIMKMVMLVIRTAPIGVFALIAQTFATQGIEVFGPLAWYFIAVVLALLGHVLLTYTSILKLSGLRPVVFLRKMRSVMTFAFSTSSSSATIPMTLNNLEQRLGAPNSIASFTVPLGATVNMDGTAIMQGVATVFIASYYGVDLGLSDFVTVIVTATLASIGTAAVPSAGLIMLAMVLTQVGLPVEGIGLIIGVDRLLDMMRTAVNVTGDSAVTCIVSQWEGELDRGIYDDPDAVMTVPRHGFGHSHGL